MCAGRGIESPAGYASDGGAALEGLRLDGHVDRPKGETHQHFASGGVDTEVRDAFVPVERVVTGVPDREPVLVGQLFSVGPAGVLQPVTEVLGGRRDVGVEIISGETFKAVFADDLFSRFLTSDA